MINYYQPFLLQFLQRNAYTLPPEIKQYYYYSWEDALWDLLEKKNIPKGSTILVPDFHCMDVIDNIENHGYQVAFYPLNEHFQIDTQTFTTYIDKKKPHVIILFHACGITCTLFQDTSWLSHIDKNTIVIEDCVHRFVNPTNITFIHSNHIVMDSLRKDSPLRGGFVYGQKEFMNFAQTKTLLDGYTVSSSIYYVFFRLILEFTALIPLPSLTKYAHEVLLKRHDDIIGDSLTPHRGLPLIPLLHRFMNFKKLEGVKTQQVKLYKELTNTLLEQQKKGSKLIQFYPVTIPFSDYPHLHVYPLGIKGKAPDDFLPFLHKKGIIVWIKFPDSPWSQRQEVLFLPLGFHMKEKDITYIFEALQEYLHSNFSE